WSSDVCSSDLYVKTDLAERSVVAIDAILPGIPRCLFPRDNRIRGIVVRHLPAQIEVVLLALREQADNPPKPVLPRRLQAKFMALLRKRLVAGDELAGVSACAQRIVVITTPIVVGVEV